MIKILEGLFEIIREECSEIIKIYKKNNYTFLYRGINENGPYFILKKREERHPRDTPKDIHDLYNKIFNSLGYKVNRSNCLFATTDKNFSMSYGIPYIVFPSNDFLYLWSEKIKDLFPETGKIFYEISKKYENVLYFEYDITYFRKKHVIRYLYPKDFQNAKKDFISILKQKYALASDKIEINLNKKLKTYEDFKKCLMNDTRIYSFTDKIFEEWNQKYLKDYNHSAELFEILKKEIGDLYNYNVGLNYVLSNKIENEVMIRAEKYFVVNSNFTKTVISLM
ncbi:MAG: hypothetical protein NZZ41_00880 [Candidatus Dojkabacteria bacterium]|nr:hypothetical protein [Candidatus Dojkabacteria bacterium]